MSERIVRHSLFRYPHPEIAGVEALAFRGQVVDLPAGVEARADEIGALEPIGTSVTSPVDPVTVVAAGEAADEVLTEVVRPRRTAPKGEWVAYAVAQGVDQAEAEATSKEDLIATFGG